MMQHERTPQRPAENRATVEDARNRIGAMVSEAEVQFVFRHGHDLSLLSGGDLLLLAQSFPIVKIATEHPNLGKYDIGSCLLRSFLQRQPFVRVIPESDGELLLACTVGRLFYNLPSHEYDYMINAASVAGARGLFALHRSALSAVGEVAGRIAQTWRETVGEHMEEMLPTLGDSVLNPACRLEGTIKLIFACEGADAAGLIERYNSLRDNAAKDPSSNRYI